MGVEDVSSLLCDEVVALIVCVWRDVSSLFLCTYCSHCMRVGVMDASSLFCDVVIALIVCVRG